MKTVKVYESFDALPNYVEAALNVRSASVNIFLTLPWLKNLHATVFAQSTQPRIYSLESDKDYHGPHLALVMYSSAKIPHLLTPRRLNAVANYYTALFGPCIVKKDDITQENFDLLAQTIAQESPRWDIVDLHPMAVDEPSFDAIHNALRRSGMVVQRYFCFGNWFLIVGGRTYAEYYETLPSRLKNSLQRKSKQLEKNQRIRIHIIEGGSDVQEGILAFEKVYQSSWKSPEPFPDFIPGLITTCAENGWLRLGIAYIDEEPAAAQLWIVFNDVASIYKLAYDERYTKLSIGSILTSRLMQHVIDNDRVREVDYLTGDEPYKQEWMQHRRERWGIIAFNLRSIKGIFAALNHLGRRVIKNLLRIEH